MNIPQPIPFVAEAQRADADDRREYFSATVLEGQPIPPRLWHVADYIPAGNVTMLSGDGGTGKSLLALQLATSTALGSPWLGQEVARGHALFISAEDDRDEIHRRLADIARAEGVPLADLDGLTIRSLAGKDALLSIPVPGQATVMRETALFKRLDGWIAEHCPVLVVLDTLADLFGGNEIDRAQARQFIGMLRGLCTRHGTTVILLAHPSLSGMANGTGTSGSTGWNNSVRQRLYLQRIKGEDGDDADKDARELEVKKANYGATGQIVPLRWQSGVFVTDYKAEGALDRKAANAKAERVFLKLLRQRQEQGRSVNSAGSSSYAPRVFADHPEAERVTKQAFARAMNTMLADGRIRIDVKGPPSRRTSYLIEGTPK